MRRSGIRHHLTHKVETPYCIECYERRWNRPWKPWAASEARDNGGFMPIIYVLIVFIAIVNGVPLVGGWFAPVIPSLKGMVIPVLIATAALSYIALAKRHETLTKVVIVVGLTIAILIGAA